jgi:hypothetical protein
VGSQKRATSVTGLGLISVGAAFTLVGGLGVGFRAAGLGYLGQSLVALTLGIGMLWIGLRVAAAARRAIFESVRTTPMRAHTVYTTAAPQPARVRVSAWTSPQLALPPASSR